MSLRKRYKYVKNILVNNKEAVNMKKSIFDKKMENPKFKAVYDEVSEPNDFTYTMPDGRQVTTVFQETDGGTKVTTTFDLRGSLFYG